MKNFTAKTADFDNLTISGQAPITPSDLGTAPNQIPLNKDLGTLAYQDAVNLDDVSADMLELRAIAAEISDSAVDVFVYDTSRDSDGGAWRKRTQHTSWYNEELNTATRGGRREFPAVAVIVSEANKVTIYDGDDPDLGMWMVFNAAANNWLYYTSGAKSSVMLNGKLANAASGSNQRFRTIDFISDMHLEYTHTDGRSTFGNGISERNSGSNSLNYGNVSGSGLIDRNCNDVAMTILPNAPIDEDTGLPVPTIAVATNGGVSVIKDDGSVYDISGVSVERVAFYNDNKSLIIRETGNACSYGAIPVSDNSWTSWREGFFNETTTFPCTLNQINTGLYSNGNYDLGIPSDFGLSLIKVNPSDQNISTGAYITSKYNTGWMPGDIKLATLSDATVETIGESSDELSKLTLGSASDGNATWTVDDDTNINVSSYSSLSYFTVAFSKDLIVGQVYEGELIVSNFSGAPDSIGFASQVNQGIGVNARLGSNGTIKFTFKHQGDDVRLFTSGGTGDMEISIRATTELITNGDFSTDATAANFSTTYPEWTANNAVLSVTGGKLRVDDSADAGIWSSAVQQINLVPGRRYTLSMNTTIVAGGPSYHIALHSSSTLSVTNADHYVQPSTTEYGAYSTTFTATTANYLFIGVGENGVLDFDNISVRPAVEDRSVNNNGLQIVGEINKTPVAPGADLVAYSGFSTNNYLVQPYNEDLDFGTGDFCVMGWFKQSPTTNFHTYFSREGRISVYIDASTSKLNFRITDGTNHMNCLSANAVDSDTWTFFVGVKSNDTTYNYINGKLEQTANYTTVGSIDGDYDSYFGVNHVSSDRRPAEEIALWRISATAPTAEQIAKIYRDEKALFTDGAQATFYGTDDAVTALAYDDKTELLHVGTSSGRSDFAGLRRINNTTTAVTTSISAHNNLIAEQ